MLSNEVALLPNVCPWKDITMVSKEPDNASLRVRGIHQQLNLRRRAQVLDRLSDPLLSINRVMPDPRVLSPQFSPATRRRKGNMINLSSPSIREAVSSELEMGESGCGHDVDS